MHDGAAIPSPDGDRRAVVMSTARLELAPVLEGDLPDLFTLHADPDAFTDDLTAPLTDRAQMRWVLAQWTEHWEQHGTGYFAVRTVGPPASNTDTRTPARGLLPGVLGVVGLAHLGTDDGPVLSAYWRLRPAAQGRGVGEEAMRAVLDHPRYGPSGHEVIAVTAAGNRPSRALAARLGFVPAPDRAVPGGRANDVLLVRPGTRAPARPGGS